MEQYSGQLMLVGTYSGPPGPMGAIAKATAGCGRPRRRQAAIREGATIAPLTAPGLHVGDVMTADPVVFDGACIGGTGPAAAAPAQPDHHR